LRRIFYRGHGMQGIAGGSPLNYNNDGNIYYWAYRRVALRLKQIGDIFGSIYGQSAINKNVHLVLAGQVVNPIVIQVGLEMIQAVYGPPRNYFYAIAGAPYFNLGSHDTANNLTVENVLAAFNESIQEIKNSKYIPQHAQLAKNYSLEFFSYEGGSDSFGPNNIQAKKNASNDPRMKPLVVDYLKFWFDSGFKNFNWFVAGATNYDTQYGTWGLTYDPNVLDTPKLQAVDQILAMNFD